MLLFVYKSCVYVFIFLEYMPKSGIAELNDNSLFNHLRIARLFSTVALHFDSSV